MPVYAYRCPCCERAQDGFASVDDRHTAAPECPAGHGTMRLEITAPYVQGDIEPYRATFLDVKDEKLPANERKPPVIGGRRAHREALKRNRLVEVGDRPVAPTKQFRPIHTDAERRRLREQMRPIVTEALRRGRA